MQNQLKIALFFFCLVFGSLFSTSANAQSNVKQQKSDTIQIKTSAVCGECKERIEKTLAYETGVKKATLDVKTKICTVIFDPRKTNPEKIRIAISNTGYDADEVAANQEAYDKLSPCCKKDHPTH